MKERDARCANERRLIGDSDVVHPVGVGKGDFGGVGAVVELDDHASSVGLENGG